MPPILQPIPLCGAALIGALSLFGCDDPPRESRLRLDLAEKFGNMDLSESVQAEQTPLPIYGGTLELLANGRHAVVTDPDRDRIQVVDVVEERVSATFSLNDGDVPWRIAEDNDGFVHIVLRGAAELITIDPIRGRVLARRSVCPNPRGVAVDDRDVWVACAGGRAYRLDVAPTGDVEVFAADNNDLRDVVAVDGAVIASRFRAASGSLLRFDDASKPAPLLSAPDVVDASVGSAAVAWRSRVGSEGRWLMVHQYLFAPPDAGSGLTPTSGPDEYYTPAEKNCGLVTAGVTIFGAEGAVSRSGAIPGVVLPVDVAMSPDGSRVAIASAGNETGNVIVMETRQFMAADADRSRCNRPDRTALHESVVAVDFAADGQLFALAYEPPVLVRLDHELHTMARIELEGVSLADTGHALFHLDAGQGMSCASCHPEGGDDGHVWLSTGAPRRTQPLDVGLAGTAPFHWEGDIADFGGIVQRTLADAMGGRPQSRERTAAFEDWVYSIPTPSPVRARDEPGVARGAQAFVDYGCASCHRGESTTQPESVAFGGHETMQVPVLVGVGTRGPFMHDGRSPDLREAVIEMVAETRPHDPFPSSKTIDELVAYLETL